MLAPPISEALSKTQALQMRKMYYANHFNPSSLIHVELHCIIQYFSV